MFEVGQKVVCVDTAGFLGLTIGGVYIVDSLWDLGVRFIDDEGRLVGMRYSCFKPHTETEAERRGAKFGVTGVVRQGNVAVSFISDKQHKNTLGETLWDVVTEDGFISSVHPENIRLDHEPEFIAWKDAPEHLKYDVSRVYYEGEPVKWIARPEGAVLADVVYTTQVGIIRSSSDYLTVKL